VKPMAAALVGALVSGVGMYAIGAHAQNQNVTPLAQPTMSYYTGAPQAFQSPAVVPVAHRTVATRRTVTRTVRPAAPVYRDEAPVVYRDVEATPQRSKTKTALVIGGSAASGAGVGAIIGGKKGALVGAALGGGAASIYEATRR
jgi:hypothetical protein